MDGGGEGSGIGVAGGGDVAQGWRGGVAAIDADVEAGLLELFFDVDVAGLDEREQVAAEPSDLGHGEVVLGDVDGLAGEMRRGRGAVGRGGVAVGAKEPLLELDGADGGVDLQRGVEAGVVRAAQVDEEAGGPGAAVAPVQGEPLIDVESVTDWEGEEHALRTHDLEAVVILDADEPVTIGSLVLVEEDLAGAEEGSGYDEAAALVIEGWKDERGGGGSLNGLELGCVDGGSAEGVGIGREPGETGRVGARKDGGAVRDLWIDVRLDGSGGGGLVCVAARRCGGEKVSGGGLRGTIARGVGKSDGGVGRSVARDANGAEVPTSNAAGGSIGEAKARRAARPGSGRAGARRGTGLAGVDAVEGSGWKGDGAAAGSVGRLRDLPLGGVCGHVAGAGRGLTMGAGARGMLARGDARFGGGCGVPRVRHERGGQKQKNREHEPSRVRGGAWH